MKASATWIRPNRPMSKRVADLQRFDEILAQIEVDPHVAVEIGDDPDRAGDDEKDDQHAEREGQNIICAVWAAAQMQKEHEVDADLREGEYDQSDGDAWGPEQIGLRHDERGDRRQDRKP